MIEEEAKETGITEGTTEETIHPEMNGLEMTGTVVIPDLLNDLILPSIETKHLVRHPHQSNKHHLQHLLKSIPQSYPTQSSNQ
jgi:hypothetical protein